MPNLRYTARGRPQIRQRDSRRLEYFGSLSALAIFDLLATLVLSFQYFCLAKSLQFIFRLCFEFFLLLNFWISTLEINAKPLGRRLFCDKRHSKASQ